MYDGNVEKNNNRHCLSADKRGFVSMYGLLVLLVLLAFVSLMIQRTTAFISAYHITESYDIYAIRTCVTYMQEYEKKQMEETDNVQEEKKEEAIKEIQWQRIYRNTLFTFQQVDTTIDVWYEINDRPVHMQLRFDEDDGSLMECVYL